MLPLRVYFLLFIYLLLRRCLHDTKAHIIKKRPSFEFPSMLLYFTVLVRNNPATIMAGVWTLLFFFNLLQVETPSKWDRMVEQDSDQRYEPCPWLCHYESHQHCKPMSDCGSSLEVAVSHLAETTTPGATPPLEAEEQKGLRWKGRGRQSWRRVATRSWGGRSLRGHSGSDPCLRRSYNR